MKASNYLLKKLIESKLFDDSKSKSIAAAIVKHQKISSICENNNEDKLWTNNKNIYYARQMEK